MKVTKFYFPLFAAAMLASCSNESEPVNNGGENNGELRYLAVNICNPAGATRAEGFENGTGKEAEVNNALFVIADSNGDVKAAVTTTDLAKTGKNESQTIEYIAKAVLVVNNVETRTPYYQMVTVVNYTDDMKNLVLESDGKTVKSNVNIEKFTKACENYGNGFIMTNSVYSGNEGAQIITPDKFRHEEGEALDAPVDVYVERVVAKVKTSAIKQNDGASKELGTATEATNFDIVVEGIDLSFTANKSNLIKSISGYSSSDWTWSVDNYHRSYWATNTSEDIAIKSWKTLSDAETDPSIKYIQENTLGTWIQNGPNNSKTSTYVMVAARLQDNTGNDIDALVALDGLYYLENQGKVAVANKAFRAEGDDQVKTESGEQLTAEHLQFVTSVQEIKKAGVNIPAYKTYAKLTDAGKDAVGEANILKAETALKKIVVKYWNGGKCYYFKQIKHNGSPELYGVVRNHVYDLSLDAIGGLGTPVVDPSDPIIPEIPDDDPDKWYLSARVNVLQWRIVPTQNITWE